MASNTSGNDNTVMGYQALSSNSSGSNNTAIGSGAMSSGTGTFSDCTAIGYQALQHCVASGNTAIGAQALQACTSGTGNTAMGYQAGLSLTTATGNTAMGYQALTAVCGNNNTAGGFQALQNCTGSANTGFGSSVMPSVTGNNNTCCGHAALPSLTSGGNNTVVGSQAAGNIVTGSRNVVIGASANTLGDNSDCVIIGAGVTGTASAQIRIGLSGSQTTCHIAGIRGITTINNNAINVVVDSSNQLGTVSSSQRYKTNIRPIERQTDRLMKLRPVEFVYTKHLDSKLATKQEYGLIAEEAKDVYPDMAVYNDGQLETLDYQRMCIYMLREIQDLVRDSSQKGER